MIAAPLPLSQALRFPPTLKAAPFWIILFCGAVLGGAHFFEHVLGYAPCALCLQQRLAWWIAMGVAGAAYYAKNLPGLMLILLTLSGMAMLAGAGLAGYHVGVEQLWWEGPTGCSGGSFDSTDINALRAQIMAAPVIRCDEIAWSLFGISMAGYNMVLSLIGVAGVAWTLRSAGLKRRKRDDE